MQLKDVAVSIFRELANDERLLDLLNVPPPRSMAEIRGQIFEEIQPPDLLTTQTRLCVYENPSTRLSSLERGWLEIDIYLTKETNRRDRRVLLIAQRLIDLLDGKRIAGAGLHYYNRLSNLPTDDSKWMKYGLVFYYDSIRF